MAGREPMLARNLMGWLSALRYLRRGNDPARRVRLVFILACQALTWTSLALIAALILSWIF